MGGGFGSVFFTSDREERDTAQLQRIGVTGGEAEALTSWRGGIADYCPLFDGRTVAVLAEDECEDECQDEGRDARATTSRSGAGISR